MTTYDAAMAVLLVLGMARGAWRGFTWQVASLASLLLGYITARTSAGQVAPYLPGTPEVQHALAMVAIYIVISGGIFAVAWMVRGTLRKLKLEAYDRHLGMLLGGAEAIGVGLLATLFVVSLATTTRQPIFSSPTGRVVGAVMNQLGPVLPAEVRKVLAPHWDGDGSSESLVANAPDAPAAPTQVQASHAQDLAPALPDIHEAADDPGNGDPAALPALEPPATKPARDLGLKRTAGKTPSAQLDSALANGRRALDQAVAQTLDPDQQAQSVRQLVEKDRQRLKNAVGGTVDRARQKVGQVQGKVSQNQQALEQAISDSIAKGQEKVEQVINDSIDQQLRRLGGLQPAASPAPTPNSGGK
jgi:membrane protein required for colicin V production